MQGCGSGFNDFVDPESGYMGKKNEEKKCTFSFLTFQTFL
jgi:hypothetical protein